MRLLSLSTDLEANGRALAEVWADPSCREHLAEIVRGVEEALRRLGSWLEKVGPLLAEMEKIRNTAPSPYSDLFEDAGADPFTARFERLVVRHLGVSLQVERNEDRPRALKAPREIVRTPDPARIRELAESVSITPEFENSLLRSFRKGGRYDLGREFLDLVEKAARGQPSSCELIVELSSVIRPLIPKWSGASVTAESCTHELVLLTLGELGQARRYSAYEDDFSDPATKATRSELNCRRFSPVSAARRVNALSGTREGTRAGIRRK